MSIRRKVLLIVGLTLVGLVLAVHVTASTVLLDAATETEERETAQAVQSARYVLAQTVDQFNARFNDWSAWDDTYEFIRTGSQEYVRSNLLDESLAGMGVHLMLFLDRSARVVWGTGFDPERARKLPVPAAIRTHLVPGDPLVAHTDAAGSRAGFLALPEGVMYVCSRPIVRSDTSGPIRGTLVVGRYLDEAEVRRHERYVRLPLSLVPALQASKTPGFREAYPRLAAGERIHVQPQGRETIAGFELQEDLFGKPAFVLRVVQPRTAYHQALETRRTLTLAVAAAGLVFLLVTSLLLDRLVLAPLSRFSRDVLSAAERRDLSSRLPSQSSDELGRVAGAINRFLAILEQYESERAEGETRLRLAKEAAEAASIAKSQFLANMSHELRTPLNHVIGYAEMLQELVEDQGHDEYTADLEKIRRAARHLLALINEVLEFSSLEAGDLQPAIEECAVTEILENVAQIARPIVEERGNRLEVRHDEALGLVRVDPLRLQQCLLRLLTNAAKFTERGTVTLEARREFTSAGETLALTVRDTGAGMEPETVSRLFQPFTQGDAALTRRHEGTGLGLALTRRTVELMGGAIGVESEPGRGSAFTIRLPLARLKDAAATS